MLERFLILAAAVAALCANAPAQPNIILILSDDAGYNEIGYTGSNDFLTPNIDALAGSGVRFTNAYVTQPTCGPSRAGLLTGLYQQSFGHEENVPQRMNAWEGFQPGRVTLAHRLRDLGYTTGIIGKWHLGSTAGYNRPLDMGFDEFFGTLAGSRHYWPGEVDEWKHIRRQDTDVENLWPFEGDQSRYDPANGRYLTDAFGEEAVAFINRHAQDTDPFFLYLSFTAPHQPYEAKSSDLAQFPNLSGYTRIRAAMTLAMDRAVGDVLDALDDNGIAQDTIVVFLNDNGGTEDRDNSPLAGFKGTNWDGGIRVPFCIRWPGMPAGAVFEQPVISLDLVPTLVAAAGGTVDLTHGVDLAPYIAGQVTDPPHDALYFRHRQAWAIRRGPWKLVRPDRSLDEVWLFNLDDDIGERTDLSAQQPELRDQLLRELTAWEATLDKIHWTSGETELNRFDHFKFRALGVYSVWTNTDVWFKENTPFPASIRSEDAYANAILEFPISAHNYNAANAAGRMTGLDFMLNTLRFSGQSVQSDSYLGETSGLPLILVPTQAGEPPTIDLTANTQGFSFRVGNALDFLGPLQLTGDGNAGLTLAGPITEHLPGQSITKTGLHTAHIANLAECTGPIAIQQGAIQLDGATLRSRTSVDIAPGATLTIPGVGKVDAPQLNNAGLIDGRGLRLILADYHQQPTGVLDIVLGTTGPGFESDAMLILGDADLAGGLRVRMVANFQPELGKSYAIVDADAVRGVFDAVEQPEQPTGVRYQPRYQADMVWLDTLCATDLDASGTTDTRDFIAYLALWAVRDPDADWNRDGSVDSSDFIRFLNLWSACRN